MSKGIMAERIVPGADKRNEIVDGSLRDLDPLFKLFGVKTVDQLAAELANLPEDEADAWLRKVDILFRMDSKLFSKYHSALKEKKAPAVSKGIAEAITVTGGAIAHDVASRASELLSGSEQTFDGNVKLSDVERALETSLSQTEFTLVADDVNFGASGTYTIVDTSRKPLLTFSITNTSETAPIADTLFTSDAPRELGRCTIKIGRSNMGNLLDKTMEGVDRVSATIESDGTIGDKVQAIWLGLGALVDVGETANLPKKIATEIAAIALRAVKAQDEATQDIRRQNANRAAEIAANGLNCPSCNTARGSSEETRCSACGAPLGALPGTVDQIKADMESLAKRGFTF